MAGPLDDALRGYDDQQGRRNQAAHHAAEAKQRQHEAFVALANDFVVRMNAAGNPGAERESNPSWWRRGSGHAGSEGWSLTYESGDKVRSIAVRANGTCPSLAPTGQGALLDYSYVPFAESHFAPTPPQLSYLGQSMAEVIRRYGVGV